MQASVRTLANSCEALSVTDIHRASSRDVSAVVDQTASYLLAVDKLYNLSLAPLFSGFAESHFLTSCSSQSESFRVVRYNLNTS